ncbi:MAG: lactate utilization protein [Hyphomicrobiales bacterium]|uniref:LutC/YkgG family protein n=1 Tax=Rhabdaerophilum calidifontis TaxID=2604328 RepID=UPI00123A492F|nr:lactate utilization protein [Rhabdaerophilum calidifontis]MCA1952995.1 lactate utilization protein [Hyphomicrobiales bacterium]MCA1999648.1 lactate utilization protein [Hyphomicrobiales bacterium]
MTTSRTTSRDSIFSSIRRSLGVRGDERIRQGIVAERLERAPKGVIPARGQIDQAGRLALMIEKLEGVQASVARLAGYDEVPAAIADYLRANNLPATIRRGEDPRFGGLPWEETALEVSIGRSQGQDLNAVSHAEAGIAETGTLVLLSGSENPTTLNFLPDNHIVVLNAADLVGDLEQVWARVRKRYGKGEMPRTLNCITGPSRSGDIEQTILLGAHGPRRLHVLVVGG